MTSQTTQFGTWISPITSQLIVSDSITIDEPRQAGKSLYFIERRPQENGRCVIVCEKNNKRTDILPSPYSARSRVHEYGGGCYIITNNIIYFVNDTDQDIYSIKDHEITRITEFSNKRFADFIYDTKHQRLISVCETHNEHSVTNSLVSINIDNGELATLAQGEDFYASPRLNPNGNQLCWQNWNHPNMPWDGNTLYLAEIDKNGNPQNIRRIAGDNQTSIFQPQWSPDNELYFISDTDGWWHIYHYISKGDTKIRQLTHGEKEFGLPQWTFSQSSYTFIDAAHIFCCYQLSNRCSLALLTLDAKPTLTEIKTPWENFHCVSGDANQLCFIAASSSEFPQLMSATFSNENEPTLTCRVVKYSSQLPIKATYFSQSKTLSFTNRHKQTVYANYYPPTNPDYLPNATTNTPPLIVICHGGPTGQSSSTLDPKKQFWTSRGFALLDVNYSGSTGYGKTYRQRLKGNWGKLDVEDCCDAANYAVASGLANKKQLIIRGSSAGGYTVLAALTFENVFSAGASYYGISELTSLAEDTHKFESRYLDQLIGAYPKEKALYDSRSPINSTNKLDCPVIFFQGIEDRVVPKEQAEKMFNALDKKGLPVAAQYYEGEQHGFRKAKTIVQSLENELSFYQLIFNLKDKANINFEGDILLKNI